VVLAIGYWLSSMAIGFFFFQLLIIPYGQWTLVIALGYCYGYWLLVLIIGNCYDYWLWLI
jgi:hypothetical protein